MWLGLLRTVRGQGTLVADHKRQAPVSQPSPRLRNIMRQAMGLADETAA
jgi:DNA-binding GntR family transcriptional regulator